MMGPGVTGACSALPKCQYSAYSHNLLRASSQHHTTVLPRHSRCLMQHPLCWRAGKIGERWTHLHPAKPLNLVSVPLQDSCSGTWHLLHP